ncbi:MAG TPA: hypothetical protein VKK31_13500 [Thermoanaerobaculia bacterium]|nr:hypothetical protein [Thermoanaerobaculia bacterium]
MNPDEYERHKRRVEEQCRAGIELLESAREAQIRALDLVWMLQGQGDGGPAASGREPAVSAIEPSAAPPPAAPEPLPAADRFQSKGPSKVDAELRARFWRLPETFTRHDVCKMLGYEPSRGALFRSLQAQVKEGTLCIEAPGGGKRPTVYRKTGEGGSPAQS